MVKPATFEDGLGLTTPAKQKQFERELEAQLLLNMAVCVHEFTITNTSKSTTRHCPKCGAKAKILVKAKANAEYQKLVKRLRD